MASQPLYTEYPALRVFALHPGLIQTALVEESGVPTSSLSFDTIALPAATALTISAGKAEWLRGRSGIWFDCANKLRADLYTDTGRLTGT